MDRLIVIGGADGPLQATVFVCIISVHMTVELPGEHPRHGRRTVCMVTAESLVVIHSDDRRPDALAPTRIDPCRIRSW